MLSALMILAGMAFGQDTVDAHGFNLVPSDGDNTDLVTMWRAEDNDRGDFSTDWMLEYAHNTLELHSVVDGVVSSKSVVKDLGVFNLGFSYAAGDRVNMQVTLPMYMFSYIEDGSGDNYRTGLGDMRLAVPLNFLQEGGTWAGLGMSIVPIVDLATGTEQLLSAQGPSAGGVLAVSGHSGSTEVSANVGLMGTPGIDLLNLEGGARGMMSVGVSQEINDRLAFLAELDYNPNLRANSHPGTDAPGELLAALRGGDSEVSWTLGGATVVSPGAGAASGRLFAGVQVLLSKKAAPSHPPIFSGLCCDPEPEPECEDCPEENNPFEVGENLDFGIVYFDFDSDGLRIPESIATVEQAHHTLEKWSEITLLGVGGHTDSRGNDAYNLDLSQRRMDTVEAKLISMGISPDRIQAVGFGEEEPIFSDCSDTGPVSEGWMSTEECHQANRRVDFTILEME